MTYTHPSPPEALPPIFLRSDPVGQPREPEAQPSRWAQLFKLDVFGTSLLSRRAAFEMNRAALILRLVLIFEILLWTAFFNLIFYADIGWGRWTVVAGFLGMIVGSVIVHFDQSFLVMDTERSLRFPSFIRLVAILSSAVAAGIVLDLIFFAQPIDQRSEEENLRWYLVAFSAELYGREMALEEHEKDRASAAHDRDRRESAEDTKRRLKEDLNRAIGRKRAADQNHASLKSQRSVLREELAQLKQAKLAISVEDPTGEAALDRYLVAEGELQNEIDALTKDISTQLRLAKTAESAISSIKAKTADAQSIIDEVAENEKARRAFIDHEDFKHRSQKRRGREDLQNWVDRYRIVADKATLREDPSIKRYLGENGHPPLPNVFQRHRILRDLMKGWPPVWPSASDENIERLKTDFNLQDPPLCTSAESGAPQPGHCRSAKIYTFGYWTLFVIAALVPCMPLIMKWWLSSEDYKSYYSLNRQAAAGNQDALNQLAAQGSDVRRLHWRDE